MSMELFQLLELNLNGFEGFVHPGGEFSGTCSIKRQPRPYTIFPSRKRTFHIDEFIASRTTITKTGAAIKTCLFQRVGAVDLCICSVLSEPEHSFFSGKLMCRSLHIYLLK